MNKFLRIDTEIFNISEILNLKYECCSWTSSDIISIRQKRKYYSDNTSQENINYYYASSKDSCLEFIKLFTDFLSNPETFLDGSSYFSLAHKKERPGTL